MPKKFTVAASSVSLKAAKLSFVLTTVSLLAFIALHFLSPEFNPGWQMVSEYALGSYGWVLTFMFLSMGLSCLSLFWSIKGELKSLGGRVGLGLLLIACLGLVMAAVFDVSHSLHGVSALLGIPGLVLAAIVISLSLVCNDKWAKAKTLLLVAGVLPLISLVAMIGTIAVTLPAAGTFGPDVPVGWSNRLLMLAYYGWLLAVSGTAWKLYKRRKA
jgi:hypothetical protein